MGFLLFFKHSFSLSYARVSLSLELFVGGSEFCKHVWPVRRADPARGIPARTKYVLHRPVRTCTYLHVRCWLTFLSPFIFYV